jgi:hypothetical protein
MSSNKSNKPKNKFNNPIENIVNICHQVPNLSKCNKNSENKSKL